MGEKSVEGIKLIGNAYKLVRPLFQVRNYFYAQVCCVINNYLISNAALYVYENEDPSQSFKMICEKLGLTDKVESNIIVPFKHLKYTFNDKNISLFFIKDCLVPFRFFVKKQVSIPQFLEILYEALSCLHHLHIRDIVHGNISLATCYFVRQEQKGNCKFALNILDTAIFTEEDCLEEVEDRLFISSAQALGQKVSYKDDLESLIYVLVHLLSKGKMFNLQRYQLQWITQTEFTRWKCCDFFKEMTKTIPPELEILIEIYAIAKSLNRTEKPSYIKLMKKVVTLINDHQRHSKTLQHNELLKKNSNEENHSNDSVDEREIKVSCIKPNISNFKEKPRENKFASSQKMHLAK